MNRKTLLLGALVSTSLLLSARADITTGLQGYWTFDDGSGSSTAADSSPNGNTGTLTDFSDATFTSMWTTNARFTNALIFNANGDTNDYVSIPDSSTLDFAPSKAFTLAAWVKLSVSGAAQTNGACIISKGAASQEQYSLLISNGVFQCAIRNSSDKSGQVVNSTISPAAGIWYHVAAIWTTSPQAHYIYINGAYNNTYTGSGFLTSEYTTNHVVSIGCRESSITSGYNMPFQGTIDDVRIYNRALSASDIYQLYTNGATSANAPTFLTQPRGVSCYLGDNPAFAAVVNTSTTLLPVGYQWQFDGTNIASATNSALTITNARATNAGTYTVVVTNVEGTNSSSNAVLTLQSLPAANITNGVVGYWKFDDSSGSSTAADSSGNGNAGVLSGFVDTTFTTMWTNGVFSGALAFNGDGTGSNVVAIPNTNVAAPPMLDFSTNPAFTLSAWVNGPAIQTNGGSVIAKGTGGGGEEYSLDVPASFRFVLSGMTARAGLYAPRPFRRAERILMGQ